MPFFLYQLHAHNPINPLYSTHSHTNPTLSESGREHAILYFHFYPPLSIFPFSQRASKHGLFIYLLFFLAVVGQKYMFPAAAAFVSLTGSRVMRGVGFYCHVRYNADLMMNHCTSCGKMGWL